MDDLNKPYIPQQPEPNWEIEEIVSPVQPKKPSNRPKQLVAFVLVVFLLVGIYGASQRYQWFRKVVVPDKLSDEYSKLINPKVVVQKPLPSVIVTDSVPTPRISSVTTNVPSQSITPSPEPIIVPNNIVDYINPKYNYTVKLVPGLRSSTVEKDGMIVVNYLDDRSTLVFQVIIGGALEGNLDSIKNTLKLSPDIRNIESVLINGHMFLNYNIGNAVGFVTSFNNYTYYATDYSGKALNTFVLR